MDFELRQVYRAGPRSTCPPTRKVDARVRGAGRPPDNDDLRAGRGAGSLARKGGAPCCSPATAITITGDNLKPVTGWPTRAGRRCDPARRGGAGQGQGRLAADQLPKGRRRLRRAGRVPAAHPRALVGGFDYNRTSSTTSRRPGGQPGPASKPFIYSAALERSFTPADGGQRTTPLVSSTPM